MIRLLIASELVVLTILWAAAAFAEPTALDRAAAEKLFREGKALMDAGDYAAACPKLAESQRRDPGGGTLLNLALCREKQGRWATAWVDFSEALGVARKDGRGDREAVALEHIAALEKKMSHVTVVVAEDRRLKGLTVTIDGVELSPGLWGTAVPIDPGRRIVAASAPGHAPWNTEIAIGEAPQRTTVEIPRLEVSPPQPPPQPSQPPAVPTAPPPKPQPPPALPDPEALRLTEPDYTLSTVGIIIGGVGAGAVIAGAVAGGIAFANRAASDDECPLERCTPRGVALNDEAKTAATISNVGFAVGAGLTAVGVLIAVIAWPDAPPNLGLSFDF